MKKQNSTEINGISENLKKGITEMLILAFLNKKDMHIYAILNFLDEYSDGVCKISYPYAAIYRLLDSKFIVENGKKVDDNRLRQFYAITDAGRAYFESMKNDYATFINGVTSIFDALGEENENWKNWK